MTVLQDCPGLTVQIISNGAPLEEFEVNDADDLPPKTAVNHVQVEQDAEFEVHWQFDPDFKARHGLLASILLHGAKVYSKIVRLKEYREARVHSATGARSKVRGRRYNQPFEFAKIVVEADSGRALDQRLRDALSSAGQIEVQFRFIKNLKSKRGKADETFKRVGLTGPVPEKALGANALSHTGSLGAPSMTTRRRRTYKHQWVDGDSSPFATYIFKYRSLAALKSLLIVPRTPSPIPAAIPTPAQVPVSTLPAAPTSNSTPVADRSAPPQNANNEPWSDSTREDLITLLDFYTDNANPHRWNRCSQEELGVLLNAARNKKVNVPVIKTENERSHVAGPNHLDDDGDVTMVEERPVRKQQFPIAGDVVIHLD